MSLLTVNRLKKVYTTRFSQNQVLALSDVNFSIEKGSMSQSWENQDLVKQRF